MRLVLGERVCAMTVRGEEGEGVLRWRCSSRWMVAEGRMEACWWEEAAAWDQQSWLSFPQVS